MPYFPSSKVTSANIETSAVLRHHLGDRTPITMHTNIGLARRNRVAGADWNGAWNVAFSPDGKYLAVVSYLADAVEIMSVPSLTLSIPYRILTYHQMQI